MALSSLSLELTVNGDMVLGESQTEFYRDQIELESFEWSVDVKHAEKDTEQVDGEVRPKAVVVVRCRRRHRPSDEPLRVGQPADLTFAPAPVQALLRRPGSRPLLIQRIFGLLGPNGPLPTHLMELARERARHRGDHGLQRFFDRLTHRLALLFYRAWAQAQPALGLDRRGDTRLARRLGSPAGP